MDKQKYDGAFDISTEEATRIIESAPDSAFRNSPSEHSGWNDPPHNLPYYLVEEIFYDGRWRHFCRTDLYDDVCTLRCLSYEQGKSRNARAYWLAYVKQGLGARIGPERFAIIDSYTDG